MSEQEVPFTVPRRTRKEARIYRENQDLIYFQNGSLQGYGRPLGEDSTYPVEVTGKIIDSVDKLRQAGWFDNCKRYSNEKLASLLINIWFHAYEQVLTEDDPLLVHYLISMDEKHSWQRPICIKEQQMTTTIPRAKKSIDDPDCNPYRDFMVLIFMLGGIVDYIDEGLYRLPNDYFEYRYSYRRKFGSYKFPFSHTIITPYVFTEIPKLLMKHDKRIWFIELRDDRGGITVVTEDQRNELQKLLGISLRQTPPDWWIEKFELSRKGLQ